MPFCADRTSGGERSAMIISDTDNISEGSVRPSPEVIREESHKQAEAITDLRRRLLATRAPKPLRCVAARA